MTCKEEEGGTVRRRRRSEVCARRGAFAKDRHVRQGIRRGFGSGALQVSGKIFAMMSSKDEFVVKLAKQRVDDLVSSSKGKRFDPGRGRAMREWLVVGAGQADRVELAREACQFVKGLNKLAPGCSPGCRASSAGWTRS